MIDALDINWKNKWTVNLSTCTASHVNGIVVLFVRAPDDPNAWDGDIIKGLPALSTNTKTAQTQANKFAKLMQQAGEIYKEALDARH